MKLSAEEGRVVGSLIEKQLTTPQQYPLTLNALVLACNQTSSREPVVQYEEGLVEVALASLKAAGWVRGVLPSHGRSVVRYRQVLDERLGLDTKQLALLAVLLLRGPQTVGELRARTDRMAQFDAVEAVEHDLGLLHALPESLVERLPRRPGQKEERWLQLLSDSPAADLGGGGDGSGGGVGGGVGGGGRVASGGSGLAGLDDLAAEVAELRAEVAALRATIDGMTDGVDGATEDI